MSSEEKTHELRLSATAKERVTNGLNDKKVDDDSETIEENKEENWIVPKHMPIDYFCTKHRNAEEKKERKKNQ